MAPTASYPFDRVPPTIGRLRNPAYTGENRCLPCTGVNLAVTAVAALAAGMVWVPLGVGVAAVGVGVATVALRGYLVPGTPELTNRYLPDRVLRWFDKAPTGDALGGIDPEAYLRAAGAVMDGADGDLVVTAELRAALADGVAALDDDDRLAIALADTLGFDPGAVTVRPAGVGYEARIGRQPAGRWESRVALATDLAAHDALARRVAGWRRLPADTRASLLGAFRLCLDSCPSCDGAVSLGGGYGEGGEDFGSVAMTGRARSGGTNTWELATGAGAGTPSQGQVDIDWSQLDGVTVPFTYTYDDAAGTVTFDLDSGSFVSTATGVAAPAGRIGLQAKADEGTVDVANVGLSVDGTPVSLVGPDGVTASNDDGPGGRDIRYVSLTTGAADLADGFVLSGDVTVTLQGDFDASNEEGVALDIVVE